MKKLLTTIGFTTVLLIASSAQADESEENYNAHTNNHVSYADAHNGNKATMPKASMMNSKVSGGTSSDDQNYDATQDPFSLDYSHDH